jgi:hypothetical protein
LKLFPGSFECTISAGTKFIDSRCVNIDSQGSEFFAELDRQGKPPNPKMAIIAPRKTRMITPKLCVTIWRNPLKSIRSAWPFPAEAGDTNPFQGSEAHIVILDVTLQASIIAGLVYCRMMYFSTRRAIQTRNIWVICALAPIHTEELAHYKVPQPISWIYILLPYGVASAGWK